VKTTLYSHHKGQSHIADVVSGPLLKQVRGIEVGWGRKQGPAIREKLLEALRTDGWSRPVKLDPEIGITVGAMKEGVALSAQFGNMARFYADLLKLQYLHLRGRATAAIYLLPMKESSKLLGENIVNFERLCTELNYFQEIIRIPILVVGLEE
jgi:hypothetical protein